VTCLKESGLGAILAKSFARIYYRNCLNAALPAISSPETVDAIQDGERIFIDLQAGIIQCSAGEFHFPALPEEVMLILKAGGLIPLTKARLASQANR
jgi:3-isopropylmalate/(R)-2-methylmalate dehydratase small subunit